MATYTVDNVNTSNLVANDIINCDYSGTSKTLTLPPGQYKLECWGARGGSYSTSSSYYCGPGGYSKGIITFNNNTVVYLYAGGQGSQDGTGASGGFNGGGSITQATNEDGTPGGGASDIRIGTDSLYARVIVAGGGGGVGWQSNGGSGGGTMGVSGSKGTTVYGNGASQTSGGAAPTGGNAGSFGLGGNGRSDNGYPGSGGGGGWYGGSSGLSDSGGGYAAGGGSGYIYTSSTASNYPSGCLLNSSYYLTDAETISGNDTFNAPTGTSETGHSGNGYIRITVISINSLTNFNLKVKVNGTWYNTTSIYVKINGTWKTISNIYTKINGTWKSSS